MHRILILLPTPTSITPLIRNPHPSRYIIYPLHKLQRQSLTHMPCNLTMQQLPSDTLSLGLEFWRGGEGEYPYSGVVEGKSDYYKSTYRIGEIYRRR